VSISARKRAKILLDERASRGFLGFRKRKQNVRHEYRSHRVSVLSEYEEEYDEEGLPWWKVALTVCLGILLLIPCVAVSQLVGQQFSEIEFLSTLQENRQALFFVIGMAVTFVALLVPLIRQLLLAVYVYGHEATHSLFVFMCYGKVTDFNASPDGGYVIANRGNILVALSPYILPFWTLVVVCVFGVLSLFFDQTRLLPYWFMLFGSTWIFNLFWTGWMIPLGQSDLSSNGTFFSLTLIYLTNVLGLSILLEYTTQNPSLVTWFFEGVNLHIDLVMRILQF